MSRQHYAHPTQRNTYHSNNGLGSTDPGLSYGQTRLGSSGEFLPRPVELDTHFISNRLPPASRPPWDVTMPGEAVSLASSLVTRQGTEVGIRGTNQDPIVGWYLNNDGPFIPRGTIPDIPTEQRYPTRGPEVLRPHSVRIPHRPSSEDGSAHYGVQSDSGYGSGRRSHETVSLFSEGVNRPQDTQTFTGQTHESQLFPGLALHDTLPGAWPEGTQITLVEQPQLICPTCNKQVKTPSELKKHDLRHTKPFRCKVPGCSRTEGFSTPNDLERHRRSKHPETVGELEPRYRCPIAPCKSKERDWPRLDNFRNHLKKVHLLEGEQLEDAVRSVDTRKRSLQSSMLYHSRSPREENFTRLRHDGPKEAQEEDAQWANYQNLARAELLGHTPPPLQKQFGPPDSALDDYADRSNRYDMMRHLQSSGNATQQTFDDSDSSRATELVRNSMQQTDSTLLPRDPDTQIPRTHSQNFSDNIEQVGLGRVGNTDQYGQSQFAGQPVAFREPSSQRNSPTSSISLPSALPHQIRELKDFKTFLQSISSGAPDKDAIQQRLLHVIDTLGTIDSSIEKSGMTPDFESKGKAPLITQKKESVVTCPKCNRFRGRRCELKKHLKRHDRPYGCTFPKCNKTFGSKNDWKRHENSQHFQLKSWRCNEVSPSGRTCAKVYYRRESFRDHLHKEHNLGDTELIKSKVEACHIGRNCQDQFWCGFCKSLIKLERRGLDAWTDRFDHIDDHFMGRNGTHERIQDWVPVDGDQPKRLADSARHPADSDDLYTEDGSTLTDGHSSESGDAQTVIGQNLGQYTVLSKRRAEDDLNGHPRKRQQSAETIVTCCQCSMGPFTLNNIYRHCMECSHQFCIDCVREQVLPQD